MARYLYSELAGLIQARANCAKTNNTEWFNRHEDTIERLCKDCMPSGSGFDNGTTLDLDASHAEKLVFRTAFHHSNDAGYYDGWTEHTVTVTPSLQHGFNLRVSGRNRNDIKGYIADTFHHALSQDVEYLIYSYVFQFPAIRPVWANDGSGITDWQCEDESIGQSNSRSMLETAILNRHKTVQQYPRIEG